MKRELKRILYAEDDLSIQAIVRVSLENIGNFTIKICDSGRQLLEEVEAFTPDLILLDVMMPDGDGPQTLSKLRKLPCAKKIPVVFITAKGQTAEILRLEALGAAGVIQKPFDPMTLPAQLHSIWGRDQHE